MSDTLPSLPDFLGADSDEELVFDEIEVPAAPAAIATPAPEKAAEPTPAPAPAATDEAKPRRGAKRGRKLAEEQEATAAEAPAEAANDILSAEAPLQASAEEPAGGAPAPFPPHGAEPAGSTLKPWLMGIVALATVSSCASLGGLLMVSRTLAHAQSDREQAAMQKDAFARIPGLVAKLDEAAGRLDAASARTSAIAPAGPPATLADVHHELDLLKLALAQHQPDGMSSMSGTLRGGFEDIATRLDRMQGQIDQMKHGPSPAPAPAPLARARAHD